MPTWEGEDTNATKDQTPKQRLLAWIQSKIPEKNITNFSSDWNDGTAIAALVDALAPGRLKSYLYLTVSTSSLCLLVDLLLQMCIYVYVAVNLFILMV